MGSQLPGNRDHRLSEERRNARKGRSDGELSQRGEHKRYEENEGGTAETYVIDPSLFNGPITQATWAGVRVLETMEPDACGRMRCACCQLRPRPGLSKLSARV